METAVGPVPRVSKVFSGTDRMGAFKVRWGIGRMKYRVDAGLYAIGEPTAESPVFVTANYKLTFDLLRRAIASIDGWILVLDTLGINVWCAAGKGTFGTDELVERIEASRLAGIVNHRKLILPQLGGPGVAGHEVKKRSGFQVVYGPVRAEEIPEFLEKGLKAEERMRTKDFGVMERLALVPMEVVPAVRLGLIVAAGLLVLCFLLGGLSTSKALEWFAVPAGAIGASILAGAVFTPLLLPWLPGRAFSIKGLVMGILSALLVCTLVLGSGTLEKIGLLISIPAMSAYLAMNFTGASTFTSLSGVRKEMRFALPLEIGGAAAGLLLWIIALLGR
jgi:acetyl-CoA decarbonylase/synthase complex subunit gamma